MRGDECIAILDFGSQYTQLIARRVREQEVYCEILPCWVSADVVRNIPGLKGIVLSGGPLSVYDDGAPDLDVGILELGVPVLGICYGMQILARRLGGDVKAGTSGEYGRAAIVIESEEASLFAGIKPESQVWMSHGDEVQKVPEGFRGLARSEDCPIVAMADDSRRLYALQFHPEVTHTECGSSMLENFLKEICGCSRSWAMDSYIEQSIEDIRRKVGEDQVILGLSGGVDSSVAAVLCHRAVGDRLTAIFIDNGLLRKEEAAEVESTFRDSFQINLRVVDAGKAFLKALEGVSDPEEKRRRIGHTFIDVFSEEARQIDQAHFLAQGTLYPDVIESVSPHGGPSVTIKTHHNVGGLPDDLKFELVEPLRELFKDEVRRVGALLGLPQSILKRHPFPGPGLGVRILGEITEKRLGILREADAIFIEELREQGFYDSVSQALAVLLPVNSVGVMGDKRTYEQVVALRAVTTHDFMTADWAELPHRFLAHVSSRIINEVGGVNRVVYDISSKPPATIEWE